MKNYFRSQWFDVLAGLLNLGLSIYYFAIDSNIIAVMYLLVAAVWLIMSNVEYNSARIKHIESKIEHIERKLNEHDS